MLKRWIGCGGIGLLLLGCAAMPEPKDEAIVATLKEAAVGSESGHDYQGALNHYTRLVEINPSDTPSLVGKARNLRVLGQPKDAIKALRQGLEKEEKPELLLELGKAQLAASLLEDARESLEKAISARPRNWDSHATMAILLDRVSEFEAADASYRKALELSPNNVAVLNNLSLSLAQRGRLDEAIAILEKIVNGEHSIPQVRQNLAFLYAVKGDLKGAERLAKEDLPPDMVGDHLAAFRLFHQP